MLSLLNISNKHQCSLFEGYKLPRVHTLLVLGLIMPGKHYLFKDLFHSVPLTARCGGCLEISLSVYLSVCLSLREASKVKVMVLACFKEHFGLI